MGKSKQVNIEDGVDVTRLLAKNNCDIRRGKGSHVVAVLPNGQKLTYYEHGEFPKGMKCFIIKALTYAGLLIFLGSIYLAYWYCTNYSAILAQRGL